MKKYCRIILFTITVISVLLFLVYREQYNRLHYVLEVFDFFGQPCNFSDLEKNETILGYHDWGPSPVWQENDEQIQFYSAFWTNDGEAKAVGIAPSDSVYSTKNCFFWYEDKLNPILGSFSLLVEHFYNDKEFQVCYFSCRTTSHNNFGVPYAVSFSARDNFVQSKKILLTNNLSFNVSRNVTICVLPTPGPFDKAQFIEFLSFHKLIGFNSFIFYGGSIPHRISKFISNIGDRFDIHTTFFPWNLPYIYRGMEKEVVTLDCLSRNKNQSYFAIVLEKNEYIVPGFDNMTLTETLMGLTPNVKSVQLPIYKHCIEESNTGSPMLLRSIKRIDTQERIITRFYKVTARNNTNKSFSMTHPVIYKYLHCTDKTKVTINKVIPNHYATDLIRSALMQMLRNKAL